MRSAVSEGRDGRAEHRASRRAVLERRVDRRAREIKAALLSWRGAPRARPRMGSCSPPARMRRPDHCERVCLSRHRLGDPKRITSMLLPTSWRATPRFVSLGTSRPRRVSSTLSHGASSKRWRTDPPPARGRVGEGASSSSRRRGRSSPSEPDLTSARLLSGTRHRSRGTDPGPRLVRPVAVHAASGSGETSKDRSDRTVTRTPE